MYKPPSSRMSAFEDNLIYAAHVKYIIDVASILFELLAKILGMLISNSWYWISNIDFPYHKITDAWKNKGWEL